MSLDYQGTKYIYIGSAVVIVLVLCLIARAVYKSHKNYSNQEKIAVKTSKGLIKMNAQSLANELDKLQAELSRHEGYERTSKFDIEINQVLEHVKQFIQKNPHDKDVCKGEMKASIMHNALADRITPHHTDQHLAHAAILSHDDLEYGSDSLLFDYLLRNIDVLIHMLQRDVCDGGLIDITALEAILRKLDADLTSGAEFDKSTGEYSDSRFMTDYGRELAVRHDPYAIPRLPLFASQASQIEGFSVVSQIRGLPTKDDVNYSLGPQNARNAHQRSQMFRENRQKIGLTHYNDEDLLFNPTYSELAL
jgi:hypothetical protein